MISNGHSAAAPVTGVAPHRVLYSKLLLKPPNRGVEQRSVIVVGH